MQLVGREEIVCWFLLVSQVSVIMLGVGGGDVIITHDALDCTVQLSSPHQGMGHGALPSSPHH